MLSQFKKYLETKGVTPTAEVEEQLIFNLDGLSYIFVYETSDTNYFRIILPNIFKIEDEKSRYDALVNDVNQIYKVAKATISNESMIWISVEQFVYSHEGMDLLFERCFASLKGVIEYFREQQSKLSHD